MKWHWTSSKVRWKDSTTVSLAILSLIQAIAEVIGFFDIPCVASLAWWHKLLLIIGLFAVITFVTFCIKGLASRKGITLNIHDNNVSIKHADLFQQKGLRLIPFNEYFDTKVDDIVIARNSLNGKFINKYVNDIEELNDIICRPPDVIGLNPRQSNGKYKFPLGRIIKYKEYLLLAFTHFDENNSAYLSHTDYEKCLIQMWKEIERVYANQQVSIPLLGSGITRFTDTPHKDNRSLVNCLLCTLKMSGAHIKQPITICLTDDIFDEINIYELKSK